MVGNLYNVTIQPEALYNAMKDIASCKKRIEGKSCDSTTLIKMLAVQYQ